MSFVPTLAPGASSYEIEHDINLIREVVPLTFPWRVHYTVLPGTLGVHCFKGRLRDAEGRPNLYPPGTTIHFQLFAAPPWSDATQHAIVISRGSQRVKVTLRCPLPGMAGEAALVTAIIRFEVTDPIKLVESCPGWEQPGTLARLNEAVAREICDVVEGVVRPLANALHRSPEWLAPTGSERLKDLIVSGTNLSDRGLSLLSDQAPMTSLEYPQSLLEALYDLYSGYCIWQRRLAAEEEGRREALAEEMGLENGEVRANLIAGQAPPLEYLVKQRPDLLEMVTSGADGHIQEHTSALRSLLLNQASREFYGGLVAALLRDLKRPLPLTRSLIETLQRRGGRSGSSHLHGLLQSPTRPLKG
ncbi:MAG: hypothetical protein ACUVX9_09235 [Anaerolineae bacterium]